MGLLMNEVRGDNYTECLKHWILCSIPLQQKKTRKELWAVMKKKGMGIVKWVSDEKMGKNTLESNHYF